MNTHTNDCIGKNVILKESNEEGVIIFFEYIPDLNHYHFKIKTKNEIITCFDDEKFTFIPYLN